MKKILVTGAAGFIGSHLVDALLARGDSVIGVDNFNAFYDPALKRLNVEAALRKPAFTMDEGDICDESFLRSVFDRERPEVVVHLAAWAGVRPSLQNPKIYHTVNVIGSQHVLDACRDFEVGHLVFASSSSVYGGSTRIPFAEDDPVSGPISPYAATKRMGELMAHVYSTIYGLHTTLLRFFTVYGPRQRPEMAIHKFARLIDEGKPIPMFGDGSTQRDYTYIDDIIDGVLKAIATPVQYEILNLGESHTTTLRALIDMLAAQIGKPAHIQQLDPQPGDVEITYANIEKAKRMIGYDPQFTMEEGIARFVDWYNRNARSPQRQAVSPGAS